MGALEPLFLLAGLVAGVPLFLHLFQRHETRRLAFPALRYLRRTERDHARRIRVRQLLLLLLRIAVILVLVTAGARFFIRGRGSAHPPTALVLVLDNSMSSGRIVGGRRVLDQLEDVAARTLDVSTDEDRIWVIRAGEPWQAVAPVGPAEARRLIRESEVSGARGDVSAALARAAGLVSSSGVAAGEIHLLSDLQATAFDDTVAPAANVPVVVWFDPDETAENHAIASVLVGGGLAPLVGQRTELTVHVTAHGESDTLALPLRVVVDERIRGAASAPAGSDASVLLPPATPGWVRGYVEADPDALRVDDRRYFAFRARTAPIVAVGGEPGLFVQQAVAVLEAAGRMTRGPANGAELLISDAGAGLDRLAPDGAVLLLPPADADVLPAVNRRLADAGVPWRLERGSGTGEVALDGTHLPDPLSRVTARNWYRLIPTGEPTTPTRTLARAGGDPWAVEGGDALGRRYLLLASPLDATSSTLPVSTDMVRFVDWAAGEWASTGGGSAERRAGAPLPAPRGATTVRLPSGDEVPVDGTRTVLTTGAPGFYTFLDGDSVLSVEAVNPAPEESDLTPVRAADLKRVVGPGAVAVSGEAAWGRAIFRTRQGPELWWALVLAALVLLVTEAGVAAAGPSAARRRAVPLRGS